MDAVLVQLLMMGGQLRTAGNLVAAYRAALWGCCVARPCVYVCVCVNMPSQLPNW